MPDEWSIRIECPTHGQMHRDDIGCRYICHGYDGEGCDFQLTDEQVVRGQVPGASGGGSWWPKIRAAAFHARNNTIVIPLDEEPK